MVNITISDLTDREQREIIKLFQGQRYIKIEELLSLSEKGLVDYNESIDMDILTESGLSIVQQLLNSPKPPSA